MEGEYRVLRVRDGDQAQETAGAKRPGEARFTFGHVFQS